MDTNDKDSNTKERLGQKISVNIEKLKGASLEFPQFNTELLNAGGFDKIESLKLAMIASGFADRPKSSRTMTVLPHTAYEFQFAQTDFKQFVENQGGYDQLYQKWRRWCVENGALIPWGNEA